MKAFFLIASLSFASAIMLVPHNGNETRSSIHDALLPTNDTSQHLPIHVNFTNDINMKYRPHLAVVQTRKLNEDDGGDQETEDAIEYASKDENQDAKEDLANNRKLLISLSKIFRKSSPPPPPPPKPAPAPKPAPKAAPAPKPAPPPPTPKPAPKVTPPPPTPKPTPKPAPKVTPPPAPKVAVIAPTIKLTPPPPPVPKKFPIFMTCDNEFDLYVNGEKVGKGDVWTKTYEFNPKVNDGDVIAIDGVDKGGPAAFIGVFNGKITKPNEWKCTTNKYNNWNKNNFDDSSWSYATSYGKNKDKNIWMSVGRGSRPNIPADAEWLWTNNNENHDRVYCRFFYNKPSVVHTVATTQPTAPAPAKAVVQPSAPAPAKAVVQPTAPAPAKTVIQPSAPAPAKAVVQPSAPAPAKAVIQPSAPAPAKAVIQPSAPAPAKAVVQPTAPAPAKAVIQPTARVVAQPSTSTKQCEPFVFPPTSHTVIKEQVGELSNEAKKKMDELITKFNGMIADIKTKNTKQLELDRKLVNETEVKSSDMYNKYTSEFTKTEQLMFNMNKLNVTLHKHLKVIKAESDYLAKLKVFKPKFLTSLDNLKEHTGSIKKDIHKTIVEGNDKNGLISILDDIRSSTEKSASLLAKAFMDHYDKYNKQLEQNNDVYKNEQKTMTNLNTEYQIARTKKNSLLNDYNEIVRISKKLKETYATSQKDEALFEDFMGKIDKLFKQNEKNVMKGYSILSTSNTACAVDVLKSHIENKRV